jgi:nicotinamidase-related amidase
VKQIFGLSVRNSLADVCELGRIALLVYDMQVGIASQIGDAPTIIENVGRILKIARDASMRIFFTRHLSLPLALMGAFQFRMAMAWQKVDEPRAVKPWFLRDSPNFPILPDLMPLPSEAVFDKITMSAFEGTPLNIALRDCGVTAIAIAGIALEVGIEPTVRHAIDLGLVPVIITDACGFGNAEAARRSLESLRFEGNSVVTDVATFTHLISGLKSDSKDTLAQ